jgi:hypothetical protein
MDANKVDYTGTHVGSVSTYLYQVILEALRNNAGFYIPQVRFSFFIVCIMLMVFCAVFTE